MTEPEHSSPIEEFAEPERSTIVGGSALVAALMLSSVVLQLSLDATLPTDEKWIAGGLGSLVALSAFVTAFRLMTQRGGMWFNRESRSIGLGITSARDIWWFPVDALQTITCERRDITSDVADFAWRTYARLHNGVEIVLVETHERDLAEAVAEQLLTRTQLTAEGDKAPPCDHLSTSTRLAVTRGVALHAALFITGFTLTVLGGALYSQVEAAPAFAFFVAPLLLFTGVALLGVVIVKRVATEHIEHRGGLWSHSFGLGPWRWSERKVSAPNPIWSLHIRPARGARLELEGQDGTLVIGHGATTRSKASIAALAQFPERFRA